VSAKPKAKSPKSKSSVPPRWRKEVESILITDAQIARRIKTLAREIERDFRGREMVVVSLLSGTVMFLADLIRHLNLPLRLDFMGVSSYGAGTESGDLVFTKELRLDVKGRDVLLVDDILDTGKTMSRVIPKLRLLKPGLRRALPQPAVRRRAAPARLQGSRPESCHQANAENKMTSRRFSPHPDLLPPGEGTASTPVVLQATRSRIQRLEDLMSGNEFPLSRRERAGVRAGAAVLQEVVTLSIS
jgi:hypoxanthine phosphoribosyltransferase